jgi:hypothetical protein
VPVNNNEAPAFAKATTRQANDESVVNNQTANERYAFLLGIRILIIPSSSGFRRSNCSLYSRDSRQVFSPFVFIRGYACR